MNLGLPSSARVHHNISHIHDRVDHDGKDNEDHHDRLHRGQIAICYSGEQQAAQTRNNKTRSITTAPTNKDVSCKPVTVRTGRAALRNPWLRKACHELNPIARAVRMKSSRITSMTAARTYRVIIAA